MKAIHLVGFLFAMLLISACTGVGGFLVGLRVGSQKADQLFQGDTVPVLVAADDLPTGTLLSDPAKQLTLKAFHPDTVPPGALLNPEDVRGKVLGRTIEKNTPV